MGARVSRLNKSSASRRIHASMTKQLLLATTLFLPGLKAHEFEPLFADDLSNAVFAEGVWSRDKDGVLSATKDQIIWTKQNYSDFVLKLEFKNGEGTNSGVFVHASDTTNWVTDSVEVQLADDFAQKWSSKPPSWQCAAIFGRQGAFEKAVREPGKWNQMSIIVSGPIITVHLNGKRVNSVDLGDFTDAKTNPDGTTAPKWLSKPLATLPRRGKIGFQGKHGGAPIYLRNIRVMEL